jgi:hypothetical protein
MKELLELGSWGKARYNLALQEVGKWAPNSPKHVCSVEIRRKKSR